MRQHKHNKTKMKELYDAGMTDQQIIKEMGCNRTTVYLWRKKNGLPVNIKSKIRCPGCSSTNLLTVKGNYSNKNLPDEFKNVKHLYCNRCGLRFGKEKIKPQKPQKAQPFKKYSKYDNITDVGGIGINHFRRVRVSTVTGHTVVKWGIQIGGKNGGELLNESVVI